jgi:hypothetical protein
VLIDHNLVFSTSVGLQISTGLTAAQPTSFVVRENTLVNIKDSTIGTVYTSGYSGTPVIPQITANNLLPATAATGYIVRMCEGAGMPGSSKCTSGVDARGNWWGTSNPAAISAAIYDGVAKFGLGIVDASSPLSAPVATAPAYVTDVSVSPDSTLGIQRGTFSAHFSRPMDQSQAPAISFADARRGTSQTFTDPSSGTGPSSSGRPVIDSQGRIWMVNSGALLRFDHGIWTRFSVPMNLGPINFSAIAIDSSDRIWVATGSGLISFDGATFTDEHRICPVSSNPLVPVVPCTINYSFSLIAIAPDGAVWLGGSEMAAMASNLVVARYNGGIWTTYTTANGLPTGSGVQSLAFGAGGDVWITTNGNTMGTTPTTNAAHFVNGTWTAEAIRAPLDTSLNVGLSLATDIDGSVWARTSTQLLRYDGSGWAAMATISTYSMMYAGDTFLAIDREGVKWISQGGIKGFDGSSWHTLISIPISGSGFVIDADGHKWYGDNMVASQVLHVVYGGYETPITGGQWADDHTYTSSYDFTSAVARGTKAIHVAGAVDTDGISIAPDSASTFKVDYAGQITDRTAPHTPTLWSSGVTGDSTGLSIQWGAVDNESPIVAVRYAVGSSPGGQDVLSWTDLTLAQTAALAATGGSAGATISRAIPGLTDGRTYYVSLQAQNAGGLWSPSAGSTFVAGQTTLRMVYLPLLRR